MINYSNLKGGRFLTVNLQLIRRYKLSKSCTTPQPRQYHHYIFCQKLSILYIRQILTKNTVVSALYQSKSEQCNQVGASERVQRGSERVQQRWSVCSRWERVQQRWSVCSNFGACAVTLERVQ